MKMTSNQPYFEGLLTKRITVPDVSAHHLVQLAEQTIEEITLIDEKLRTWDFMRDERGKTYEVAMGGFERRVETDEVCTSFREREFFGSVAAFIAWTMENKPFGLYTSIPVDVVQGDETKLLHFNQGGGRCHLMVTEGGVLNWAWKFVAFREIK